MPRRRSVATRENDIRAIDLRRRGLTYEQIATQLGFRAASSAYEAVQRGLAEAFRESAEALTQLEAERLDALRRLFERIAATKHYAVSLGSGKVIMDPANPGQPLTDDGPAMQAGLALLRVSESWRKLKGLDAPAKSRVEVISENTVDAEIKRLEDEMAARDRDHSGTT